MITYKHVFFIYLYIYIMKCSKKHETVVEGHKHFHVRRHVHFHTHTHTYTYTIHIHIHIHEETNRTNSQLIPSAVSLRIAENEQLYQAQRMIGGIGNVLLSRPVIKLKMGKIHSFLVVNL